MTETDIHFYVLGVFVLVLPPFFTLPAPPSPAAAAAAVQVVFMTTDGFLGKEGKRNEERLVHNAVQAVRDGANDLALQLRVKDAGEARACRRLLCCTRTVTVCPSRRKEGGGGGEERGGEPGRRNCCERFVGRVRGPTNFGFCSWRYVGPTYIQQERAACRALPCCRRAISASKLTTSLGWRRSRRALD